MSYYDPYYPTLEATRLQIQRSFMALQEKLRLQRQYDLNLDLQNADRLRRGHQYALAAQEDQFRYREALANTKYLQANAYERQVADRIKYANEQETGNLRHLSKIQRLERQRLQLRVNDPQLDFQRRPKSSYLSPYHGFEEDEKLLRKYQDGTRARQLKDDFLNSKAKYNTAAKNKNEPNDEIQRTPYNNLQYASDTKHFSNEKLSYLNNLHSEGKKVQNRYRAPEENRYQRDQERQPRFGEVKDVPRISQNLRSNQANKSARNDKYSGDDREHSNEGHLAAKNRLFQSDRQGKDLKLREKNIIQAYQVKKKNRQQPNDKTKQSGTKARSRSQKQLNISQNNVPGQSPFQSFIEANTDRPDLKPKQNSQNKSALDRSRNIHPSDRGAWQKIKKRLKCSYTTYKDSDFHNVKHELNHLFNTYDCESRMRKDIKMKINSHPAVLKKHAMVVQ